MSEQASASWCPDPASDSVAQARAKLGDAFCVPGSLMHTGWQSLLLTGALRRLLISKFAQATNIEQPDLRSLIWRDNPSSGIMIESVHRWLPEMTEKRPALLIKRNAYQNLRVTIGDHSGPDGYGDEHFQTFWVGSHSVFCIHQTGASCEILATEVQRELTELGPVFVHQLALDKFQVTEVGAIAAVAEARQAYVIPITIGWAYQQKWKLAQEALPLAAIQTTIELQSL